MTLGYPTETIIAQAITSAIDGVLAKSQHELQGLLRDLCETTARVFIQKQQQRTTPIFEEDGEDDVISNHLLATTNHNQNQPQEQDRDFVGTAIYDVYDDEISTAFVYDFCRELQHKSEDTTHEGDTSSQTIFLSPVNSHGINEGMTREKLLNKHIFTSNVESFVSATNFADKPICGDSDDELFMKSHYCRDTLLADEDKIQGFPNDCDVQVVVDDAYICFKKQSVNFGLREKACHRESHHEPPGRHMEHTYVDLVPTHKRLTNGFTYTELWDETGHILKPEHDQEVCLSELSLIGKHTLENKITYLQEALALEMEKNRILEHELKETHKQIRMLNKGSATLDKILSMGRTEKSTMGLGYQGDSSTSQTVFVRGQSVEKNKATVDLGDECCCDTESGPLEWIVSKQSLGTENDFHRVITASQPTGTKDVNLATAAYLGATSMVAHLRFCEYSWKYGRGTLYDSLGVTHVSFKGIQTPLFPKQKTMDPVVPNEEIVHLSSPICLDKFLFFQTVAKLSGEDLFLDVVFVIYIMRSTWRGNFSKGSLQNFGILGADVSYGRHQHVCALMHLDDLCVGKGSRRYK